MASSPSPTHIALKASLDGNLSLLKEMASKVNLRGAKDAKGGTALHYAAFRGCLESCRFLVEESGIDVNSVTKTGVTPMLCATQEGNVQVMRYLLDRGGDPAMPDEKGSTPLHNVALQGHCEAVRLLLSKGVPVDPVDHRGAPLHLAASNDHVEVVKVLLEHAADLNKVVNHIVSPLVMALCGKSLKCIKLLIEAGADVNAPGYPAQTPLTLAVHEGLTDIVKLLLEAGADPNIPDVQGAIPIEQAAAHRQLPLPSPPNPCCRQHCPTVVLALCPAQIHAPLVRRHPFAPSTFSSLGLVTPTPIPKLPATAYLYPKVGGDPQLLVYCSPQSDQPSHRWLQLALGSQSLAPWRPTTQLLISERFWRGGGLAAAMTVWIWGGVLSHSWLAGREHENRKKRAQAKERRGERITPRIGGAHTERRQ